jgi:FdhD protein
VGFEIVQKAAVAGIPAIVAVGAPTSLAVDLARTYGLTVLGFARDRRMVVYSHPERLSTAPVPASGRKDKSRLLPSAGVRVPNEQ